MDKDWRRGDAAHMLHRRLFLGACAAVCALPTLARAAGSGPVVIPFLLSRDRAIMLVGINGKGPFRFMIDTGDAVTMLITEDLAKELKLPDTDGRMVAGVVGHGERAMLAAEEVNLGGVLRQRHVGFAQMDGMRGFGEGIVGAVPAQLFLSTHCEIDFDKHEVRLWLQGAPDRTGFVPVRLQPPSTSEMVVDCTIDGAPCRLKLDTGAPGSILLQAAYVARRNLWNAYPKFLPGQTGGITGSAPSRLVKASSLKFGPYTFRDPLVKLTDPQAVDPIGNGQYSHDGLFGLELLRRFTLSMDGPAHTLWLKPNSALGDAYRIDRSGLTLWFYRERRETRITAVEADSPAAKAGLRVGDRLEGIDSLGDAEALRWQLSGYAGDVVEVAVSGRDGSEKHAITLADRL